MKAAPKVNTDGLYTEDTIVDDIFSGVVPFYEPLQDSKGNEQVQGSLETSAGEQPTIAGYTVGIPVPSGLYLPKFDLEGWNSQEEGEARDPSSYWMEGLTKEEIEELTTPHPQEANPLDLLGEELAFMKLSNIEQQQMIATLGAELSAAKLEIIDLKGV
ncbi:hypothetical protein [Paenibacillus sp. GM2]|uniref:hypothetical protein n=1 Tax=Paenibacillus sp. GM2 TaxID=1622070 RepID=UPI000839B7DD|nr:hypothetical protein [Paenibacillus sp. GM2]